VEKLQQKVTSERSDPYSARMFPKESRTEKLAMIIRQEESVENIVRTRTWGIVRDRCGEMIDNWETAYKRWTGEIL
jgi:hypothetical protein